MAISPKALKVLAALGHSHTLGQGSSTVALAFPSPTCNSSDGCGQRPSGSEQWQELRAGHQSSPSGEQGGPSTQWNVILLKREGGSDARVAELVAQAATGGTLQTVPGTAVEDSWPPLQLQVRVTAGRPWL